MYVVKRIPAATVGVISMAHSNDRHMTEIVRPARAKKEKGRERNDT